VEALVVTGDETPRVLWRTSVNAPVYSTPAVYDNTLYFGNQDGTLTALNATTGVLECSMRLPIVQPETVPGHIYSSPVVGQVDDTGPIVYFGDSGQHEWLNGGHEWAMTGVGNTAGGCQQRWVFDAFANRGTAGDRTGSWSEPALVKDRVGTWLLVFGTSNPDDSIYALDAATGAEVWQYQTAIVGSDDDVGAGPTISAPWVNGFSDGVVYDLGKDGIEVALDLGTGQPIWTYSFVANAGGVMDAPSVADLVGDTLYEDYHGYVYSLNATTGALNWRTTTPMGYTVASPSISGAPGDQVLFIGDTTGVVNGYRLSDGALVWSTDLGGKVLSSPAISDGLLLLGSTNTVYGFRPVVPPPTHERH
jgi:outer membrane protein assembly factor BamB